MIACVLSLLLAIGVLAAVGLGVGDHGVPLGALVQGLFGDPPLSPEANMIIMDLRLPRVLLEVLVGVSLAVAGTIAQALMRNPLAEPGLLGINAGAALATTTVIVACGVSDAQLLPVAGFAGGGAATLAVYALSWRNGTASLRIILIGIGVSALATAATTLMTAFGDVKEVQRAMIWLAGSLYLADWDKVRILALWLLPALTVALLSCRDLDLIRFGDQVARSLGQRVEGARAVMILLCALLSGAAVAAAGLIGFVGLMAPHMARGLVGPGHRRVIPVAALIGAAMVMAADLLGRTVVAPVELPAGLMTALVGAPFFGYLLWGRRHVAV